jgi:dipeptidyl aminopeptidase/acylaminoacyl peptidase
MRGWSSMPLLLVAFAVATAAGPAASQSAGHTVPFTAEDMLAVVRISGPVAVAPAGDRIAYVLPDLADEWNVSERQQRGAVYLQSIGDGRVEPPVRVSPEGRWASFPAFSPDGSRLAFYLEDAEGDRLTVLDLASGRTRAVGNRFSGKAWAAPEWASDRAIVYARPAAAPPTPTPPRVQVLHDTDPSLPGDAYFRRDRRSGLVMVDLGTDSSQTLLPDGSALRGFELAPDRAHLLVSTAGERGRVEMSLWGLDPVRGPSALGGPGQRYGWAGDGRLARRKGESLVARTVDASSEEVVAEGLADLVGGVSWSPDGEHFAVLVADRTLTDPEIETPQPGMYTIARPFTDIHLASLGDVGTRNLTADITGRIRSPVWSTDGSNLFFIAIDNESYDETLYRYAVAEGQRSVLAQGSESFGALLPVPSGLLVSKQSATSPADLWLTDLDRGDWTRVTRLNPQLSRFAFSQPELFHFDNADGDRLGALLYKPAGTDEAGNVPVITYVYEKLTPGIHRFSARQQIFATHGYAVLMPNVKVKVGQTGTSFVNSVVPAVAAVREMGFTNGRFCLWGGSFGAYATSFVITQTDIFDCAVSRATPPELFRNWASGRDRDSNNIESGQARMGGSPFEVMDRYLSQSAFFHLDEVETPVLLMHGEKDYTILFEEGAMMFYALRRLGKTATFVAYRDGDHSLYRHSRVDALDVHRRMLDWFEKYLRPEGGGR